MTAMTPEAARYAWKPRDIRRLPRTRSRFFDPMEVRASDGHSTDVMIALLPMGSVSWSRQDLPHVTVIYGGSTLSMSAPDRYRLEALCSEAADSFGVIVAPVTGTDVFGTDERVDVLRLETTWHLEQLREMFEWANRSEFVEFKPHATIGPEGSADTKPPEYLKLDRLLLSWGSEQVTWFLHGSDEVRAKGGQFAKGGGRVPAKTSTELREEVKGAMAKHAGQGGSIDSPLKVEFPNARTGAAIEPGRRGVSFVSPELNMKTSGQYLGVNELGQPVIDQVFGRGRTAVKAGTIWTEALGRGLESYDPNKAAPGDKVVQEDRAAGKGGQFAKGGGRVPGRQTISAGQMKDFNDPGGAGASALAHLEPDGRGGMRFTAERAALHEKLIQEQLSGVPRSADPTTTILGGGPGAGKSASAGKAGIPDAEDKKNVWADPDKMKAGLPEFDPKDPNGVHEESSYLAKELTRRAQALGLDVVIDGVADNPGSVADKIASAKAAGHKVKGNFTTTSIDLAQARNQKRARTVKPSMLAEKHAKVSKNFTKIADLDFDEVVLWENNWTSANPAPLRLVASKKAGGSLTIADEGAWQDFQAKASDTRVWSNKGVALGAPIGGD